MNKSRSNQNAELPTCTWAQGEQYQAYHDQEWGRPCHDDLKLFEKICLEGQQAGLSWITILKKRENYRQLFHYFVPEKVAAMTDDELEACLLNTGIIRNRLKVFAIRANAQAYLKLSKNGETLKNLLWSFVGHQVKVNHFSDLSQVPAVTEESTAMSKALKKRGFKFVGPTTCYALMQAMGLVDDHMLGCPLHTDNRDAH